MEKMTVRIMTPDKTIFEVQATRIHVCGWDGYFTILPQHAPMVASLKAGEVEIEDETEKVFYVAIDSGIVEVTTDRVDILSQVAIVAEEPNVATAKMKDEQQVRQKRNTKVREQLIKSEMELYRLLRQANES